jgi:cell division protein FtsI (penicillin-binding protein 3)
MIMRRRSPRVRLNATLLVIGVVLSLFAGRLVQVQGLDWSRYRTAAQQQRTTRITIPTIRGSITTSDGIALALTLQTDEVAADPPLIPAADLSQVASELAGPLAMPPATILALLQHPSSPDWVKLKQTVSAATAQQISDLKLPGSGLSLPGISLTPTYLRSYPNGRLAANLIGFTNTSPTTSALTGQAGLEAQYNFLLAGRPGSEEVQEGPDKVPIPLTEADLRAPVPARSLRLTINSSIQYEAERECQLRVLQTRSRNCSIVVMQPGTGDILAMAQYPTFDPSNPVSLTATNNIAATNVFAPGSTLKPLTVAAALEKGGQTPGSTYTVPAVIQVHGFTFHDAEAHATARYTVAGILAYSSNDGMVQVVQHITPLQQYDYLRAFGLGSVSGLGIQNESAGLLSRPGTAGYLRLGSQEPFELSFGQGIGVTAIQMASVYATIANGGVRVAPTLVAGTTSSTGKYTPAHPPQRRRVIQATTASQLMTILQQVPGVDAAQGVPWGMIAGYSVASKTGTAQVSDQGRCLCQYGSSYIGIAPVRNPQLVVAVNIQDPKAHGYYGDEIAGPVFYKVMKFALQTMKIPPTGGKPPHITLARP